MSTDQSTSATKAADATKTNATASSSPISASKARAGKGPSADGKQSLKQNAETTGEGQKGAKRSGRASDPKASYELAKFIRPSRVVIDRLKPEIDGGRFPAKRYIDEPVEVGAVVLIDGHDHVKARMLYKHETDLRFQHVRMVTKGNDEWTASFQPEKLGRYFVTVEAAIDRFDTWKSDIVKKLGAGQLVEVDLQTGALLFETWLLQVDPREKDFLREKISQLKKWAQRKPAVDMESLRLLIDDPKVKLLADGIYDQESYVRMKRELPIQIEPKIARFSSWYEFFPRSTGAGHGTDQAHGTFRDAMKHLDYVKQMGFDVVYFPPIHPIGQAFRKGRNNTLTPEAGDVGSPWAIGAETGGHTEVHPDLGTLEDFDALLARAKELGIEIALDIAFQCSPDHPYVKLHQEWFKKRPDGSIQYAENPPKKYQDIYPFDFESKEWHALWKELCSVVQFWVDRGVRVFRVDNPHTKALHFWEWLIAEVKAEAPETVFLSEAFTRPHLMAYLAKAGFTQSYTYFTWRNTKYELTQYMTELTKTELADYFMPNFWPNTPDINPKNLQADNRAMYMQRLILAATLSSSYGIYGPVYELMDYHPMAPGKEEYLNSEKYQLRDWDLAKPGTLAPLIERLNEIRRSQVPLQSNRNFEFHTIPNDFLIAYSKSRELEDGSWERILVVVNLDPHQVQSGLVELPLIEWKIDPSETFQVHDLLTDARYFWSGWRNYVELNPQTLPAHIFAIRHQPAKQPEIETLP